MFPFATAADGSYSLSPGGFWWPLLISCLFGWFLLLLASMGVVRRWQDQPITAKAPPVIGAVHPRRKRAQRARGLLDKSPVAFLVADNPATQRMAWVVTLLWVGLIAVLSLASFGVGDLEPLSFTRFSILPIFGFVLKALVAVQACRFFAQSRLDGSLELLLSTPLTTREILRGQAIALTSSFLWPVLVFVGAAYVPVLAHALIALPFGAFPNGFGAGAQLMYTGVLCLRFLADIVAVAFVGTWLSLSMKKPGLALATSIVAVLILPSLLCWLDLLVDFVFVAWASTQLTRLDLRRFYF